MSTSEVIIADPGRKVFIYETVPETLVTEATTTLVIEETRSSITIAEQGVQGPPGAGQLGFATAGEPISVYSVVVSSSDGKAYLADPTNLAQAGKVLGLATQSASTNSSFEYASVGTVSGGLWTPGQLYFVGLAGALSSTPRPVGALWIQSIGVGKTSSSLNVSPGLPTIVG